MRTLQAASLPTVSVLEFMRRTANSPPEQKVLGHRQRRPLLAVLAQDDQSPRLGQRGHGPSQRSARCQVARSPASLVQLVLEPLLLTGDWLQQDSSEAVV